MGGDSMQPSMMLPVSHLIFHVHQNAYPIASLAERPRTASIRFTEWAKMIKIYTYFHYVYCPFLFFREPRRLF